jgi:hypothetical protein
VHSSKGYEHCVCVVNWVRQPLNFCFSRPRRSFQPTLAFFNADEVAPCPFWTSSNDLSDACGDLLDTWISQSAAADLFEDTA